MNTKLIILLSLPPLLGWLLLNILLNQSTLKSKASLTVFAAPVMGLAMISGLVFGATVLLPQQARLLSVLMPWCTALLLMAAWTLQKQNPVRAMQRTALINQIKSVLQLPANPTFANWVYFLWSWSLTLILTAALIQFVFSLMTAMTWNAFGGWDARYFWHLKPRFYVRDPEQWRLLFTEYFRWANNDYPLMVPGMIAWGWHFLGKEALIWPALISCIFSASLGLLVIWHLSLWRSWPTAAVAGLFYYTLPAYLFWGGTMYCDIPYAFFSNGALLLLINALRLKDRPLLTLSALLAGCSPFTKNEGLVFLIWYGLIALMGLIHLRRGSVKELMLDARALTGGILIPLSIALYFKLALTGGQNNLVAKRTAADVIAALSNGSRNSVILEGFYLYMTDPKNWNGLWYLTAGASLYWLITRKQKTLPYSGLILAAIVLINIGYAFIFTITPHSIYKHIQTALMRLLLQTGALGLVFIFETFGLEKKVISLRSAAGKDSAK